MADLKLNGVYKYYDKNEKAAVHDFNLDVKHNEFVVFVGPSGCGKSTTLRMIAGLEEISKGEILIDGVVVNNKEPKDRDIAMVFQNYALYPHMTVYGNMAFGLKLAKPMLPKVDKKGNHILDENGDEIIVKRHYTKQEIKDKVLEAARILEIEEYLYRKPRALSGGQRQRVAIGRAFVRKPKIFLMDEPLSNLDAKLRNQMRAEIISLHKKINTTFIYVTHDQIEAMTLGDRIVIMKDGLIQQVGTPKEVFNNPKNLFVAGFIGTPQMNFFNCRVNENGDVVLCDQVIKLNKKQKAYIKEADMLDKEVILGVRPEHFSLDDKKAVFTCDVELSEMMGSEYYVHAYLDNQKIIIRSQIIGLSDKVISAIENREELKFSFSTDNIHIFNRETEEAIF